MQLYAAFLVGRYELLEHLLDTGAVALLDELMVEWHGWRHETVGCCVSTP
eukprot:SAG31_NODE_1009_length_10404_cov_27.639981_13_plen_50_part_00